MWYYVIYWYKTKTKNTAVFPAYIAQNESEESYMYSYLKKNYREWGSFRSDT